MLDLIETLLPSVETAESIDELDRVCIEMSRRLGAAHYALTVTGLPDRPPDRPFYRSTYPAEWTERYTDGTYRDVDPVISRLRSTVGAFRWSVDEWRRHTGRDAKRIRPFVDDASEFRINRGISVPMHGPGFQTGALHFVVDGPDRDLDNVFRASRHAITLVGALVHSRMTTLLDGDGSGLPVLTPRQCDVLCWAARGKTSWDIGVILGISERAVLHHIGEAQARLNCVNRTQAVVRAIMLGEICP